jgi:hypothetical protein
VAAVPGQSGDASSSRRLVVETTTIKDSEVSVPLANAAGVLQLRRSKSHARKILVAMAERLGVVEKLNLRRKTW